MSHGGGVEPPPPPPPPKRAGWWGCGEKARKFEKAADASVLCENSTKPTNFGSTSPFPTAFDEPKNVLW